MTAENPAPAELNLSADFALRVLLEADRVVANRRRTWRNFGAATAILTLACTVAFGMHAVDEASLRSAPSVRVAVARASTSDASNQVDALSYLFPDAGPVEQFDRTYLSPSSTAGSDDILADNAADGDGGL